MMIGEDWATAGGKGWATERAEVQCWRMIKRDSSADLLLSGGVTSFMDSSSLLDTWISGSPLQFDYIHRTRQTCKLLQIFSCADRAMAGLTIN